MTNSCSIQLCKDGRARGIKPSLIKLCTYKPKNRIAASKAARLKMAQLFAEGDIVVSSASKLITRAEHFNIQANTPKRKRKSKASKRNSFSKRKAYTN